MTTHNVVILGPKGSGKTVYLASLYHKLAIAEELGYSLAVPPAQSKALRHMFTELVVDWPHPTSLAAISKWDFEVMVRGDAGNSHKAASIAYYDYAGERMHELQSAEVETETKAIFDAAHVMLGLLDGKKLHDELRLHKHDPVFWSEHVSELCIRLANAQHQAVHFVVSKWDLFEDSDQSLQEVRALLESYGHFKDLVEGRKRKGWVTRLIPISSVGYGYCEPQADGTMTKHGGRMPAPFQVEVPFACVLPDLIQTELKRAHEEAERQQQTLVRPVYAHLSFWESLKLSFSRVLSKISQVTGLKDPVIDWLIKTAPKAAERKMLAAEEQTRMHRIEHDELEKKVRDADSATIFVLHSMANSVTMLERAYPSSKLT